MKQRICLSLLLAGLAALAPVEAQTQTDDARAPSATGQWLMYKANPQRTSAVDINFGQTLPNLTWRHSTEIAPRSYDTAPLVLGPPGRRRIYFALDKIVFCIDGQTGQEIKRTKPLSAPIASPIATLVSDTGDLILVVTNRGELIALRASDLGEVWKGVPDKEKTVSVINSAPVLVKTPAGDRIILAIGTGRLVAFTTQGQLDPKWEVVLGSFSSAPTATTAVSRDGSLLYVPTQDKRLWVVNAAAAKVEYSIAMRTAAFSSPVVTDEHLVVVNGTTLNGLLLRTGRQGWVFDVKSDLTAPAAQKNADGTTTIFVGARNGRFYALDAANGKVLWNTDLADSVSSTPTATNDMIFTGTRNGMIFGLAPADGKVLWRYRLRTERVIPQSRNRNPGGFGAPGGFGNPGGFGAPGGFGGDPAGPGMEEDPAGEPGMEAEPGMAMMDPGLGVPTTPRRNPNDKDGPIWEDTPTITYGVSTTPVVLDGQVYILADNAALYSFDTQPFDAAPPQLSKPQLSILNSENKPMLQRLDGEKGWLGPGRGPVEFSAEINDVGSGLDPASIRVTLNQQEIPFGTAASFSDVTGKLLLKLTDDKTTTLEDGNQTLVVTARDYRGNEMVQTITFMIDNSAPVPRPEPVNRGWRNRNNRNF